MDLDGEVTMDMSMGPAALGGMVMCVALAAWMLGRWQGVTVADEESSASAPASGEDDGRTPAWPTAASTAARTPAAPCQHAARAERHVALDGAASLGEMHAEITAYRRAEQVLVRMEPDVVEQLREQGAVRTACRYLGVTGEPTCGISATLRAACSAGTGCGGELAVPLRPEFRLQPSPFAADLTRV